MSITKTRGLLIEAIPAFSDNYIWLLRGEGTNCAVVDPGEPAPVLSKLKEDRLQLGYILLTHHHFDHVGGTARLRQEYPDVVVFGPKDERITEPQQDCAEGDDIELSLLSLRFSVLEVPAHTRTHIAFFGGNMLFCGDTLFSVGCGRLFEGTPEQMQTSLDKLAALPPHTEVYCGHEYTLSNCQFALQVEPDNRALRRKAEDTARLREAGSITLPGTIGEELEVNPFLRTRHPAVVKAARARDEFASPGASTLGVIRRWKDSA